LRDQNGQKKRIQPETPCLPISLLAFVEAGYNTVHLLFPFLGSSDAKTLPVAEELKDSWEKAQVTVLIIK